MSSYCTLDDVRHALSESGFDIGPLEDEFVKAAAEAQSEWLQESTNRHWYDTNASDALLYDEPLTHADDHLTIPTSRRDTQNLRSTFPNVIAGGYVGVRTTRRDLETITELLVRNADGVYEDWVSDPDATEGRDGDYWLHVESHSGVSTIYLSVDRLDRLETYNQAVLTTYDYGIPFFTDTVRRGMAFRAASELVLDDELQRSISNQGQQVNRETKANQMREISEQLLGIHFLENEEDQDDSGPGVGTG